MTKTTLIEFPCHFPVKIIGINSQSFLQEIKTITAAHFSNFTLSDLVQRTSKNNNYLAITVSVFAMNQHMLDEFYTAISKVTGLKMVL